MDWATILVAVITAGFAFLGVYMSNRKQAALIAYRLEKLEAVSRSFPGIASCYAIQAGREIRIMVKPEEVSEDQMTLLARDIAKKIEAELTYPGQIKVHVLRETKAVDYAK